MCLWIGLPWVFYYESSLGVTPSVNVLGHGVVYPWPKALSLGVTPRDDS